MSEILRKWLATRLGIILDNNLMSFGEIARDGSLIAEIFQNYGIIDSRNVENICKTSDPEIAYTNLLYLNKYFKFVGIECPEKSLRAIAEGQGTVAVKLFYQIYVTLNTKSKLKYVVNNKCENNLPCLQESESPAYLYNACVTNEITGSKDINDTKDILKWHKDKYSKLMKRCKKVREEYVKYLAEKLRETEKKNHENLEEDSQIIGFDKKCEKPTTKFPLIKPDIDVTLDEQGRCLTDDTKGKAYIDFLKQKYRKCEESKMLQTQVHKMLLAELIDDLIRKEDGEFKEVISKKLLKQSCYEKQITRKLVEVHHQKEVMLENLKTQQAILNRKREEDFMDQLYQRDVNISLREKRYIANKKRQLELHKRLWAEKKKRKYKKHYELCTAVVSDIIDLAYKTVEYREAYGMDMPKNVWREWKSLFRQEQPIYPMVEDIIEVIEEPEEFDEPLTQELYRQIGLDKSDFYDYHHLYAGWDIEQALTFYEENLDVINSGANILGFIVHRLLLRKYPYPLPPPPPVLPTMDVRTCLIGLENHEIIPILQNCLTKKEILVLEIQTIINFCLEAYHDETTVDDVDTKLTEETGKTGKKEKKEKNEKNKKKDKKSSKDGKSNPSKKGKKESSKSDKMIPIEYTAAETQTPRIFPCDEIHLSEKAKLGQYAYETLHLGLHINDRLLMTMILQYLKQLNHVKGWVMVNFPETLEEAYMLEEILTGKPIPKKCTNLYGESSEDEDDLEYRDELYETPSDPYITIRTSNIVPDPRPVCREKCESYFTSFINMKYISGKSQKEVTKFLNDKNPKYQLEAFYNNLSINNSFDYEKVDYLLIKELIKRITKDDIFANSIYDELVEAAEKNVTDKRKKAISDLAESEVKGKKGKEKGGKGKQDKSSKKSGKGDKTEPEVKPEEPPPVIVPYFEPEIIPDPPKPGEDNWEYVKLDLPLELLKILANTWQKIEEIYINDFKQLFFVSRVYQNQIVPYVHDTNKHMTAYIERPDKKQEYLHMFQAMYNNVDKDLREDNEFKLELHCRISEFRMKLWNMCDMKMKESEEERQRIINENWFTYHSCTVTDNFITASQLELDRCMNSLQLLQDYYTTMINQKPLDYKYPKHVLLKMNTMTWSNTQTGKKTGVANPFDNTSNTIAHIFIDTSLTSENSPFIAFLENTLQTGNGYLFSWRTNTLTNIKHMETAFVEVPTTIKKSKKKKEVSLTELEIKLKDNIEALIQEWTCAVEGEIYRAKFRINLIFAKAVSDINSNLYYGEQVFHNIFDHIKERYDEEVNSVDVACQVLGRAVEACEPVQPRLILGGAKFLIDKNNLFYPDPLDTYEPVKEKLSDTEFSIAQLNNLSNILLDLAPNGSMPERAFVYLLQDLVVQKAEDGRQNSLPGYWHLLKPLDVSNLVRELYGTSEYIDWKDFVIWNLILPFPTELELLEVRGQFRELDPDCMEFVNMQQFLRVHFWFEIDELYDQQEALRINLIKHLLSKMFKIHEDQINYTALLLYFCKDPDPILGVSKAFELSAGCLVCWNMQIGSKFLQFTHHQQYIEEQKRLEALTAAESALNTIVNTLMKQCTSSHSILNVSETGDTQTHSQVENTVSVHEETPSLLLEETVMDEEHYSSDELPSLCYYLPFEVLLVVMTAALPWHVRVQHMDDRSLHQDLEIMFNSCRREEFDNKVFMHEFLNSEPFTALLNRYSKFIEKNPPQIVKRLVEVCTCDDTDD